MSKLYKNNTTGVNGVCYETIAHKYRAYITVHGEKIKLGYFNNLEDAALARKNAELYYRYNNNLYPNDSQIIRFVIKSDDSLYKEAFYHLIEAAIKYDGTLNFPTYASSYIADRLKQGYCFDPKYYDKFNLWSFDDKQYLKDWLNGDSFRTIAKRYNISPTEINRKIRRSVKCFEEYVRK